MAVRITYFVHGTTTDNERDLATGWSQGELSESGIKQAGELGKKVADRDFDAVFCSDLKRAVDSAKFGFADRYGIIADKRLRECNYGKFTRKPTREFKDDMKQFVDTPFPKGEGHKDVEKRVADFLKFLKQNYDDKHIAIVAHQAPQWALDVLVRKRTFTPCCR